MIKNPDGSDGSRSEAATEFTFVRCRATLSPGICHPCRGRKEQSAMPEIIDLGSLKLKFLQSKDDTAGSIDMFEMTLQPNARMPIPHYHDRWDETIYGLDGITTWRVDGSDIDLAPGETVFIKRGIVHGFTNRTSVPATCLCALSPGVLGTQYFKDIAGLLAAGMPDPARMKEVMLRHGLIPAPPA
jgi:quercetin dioxygenase-like cupin family protein